VELLTVGYEGLSVDRFFALLRTNHLDVLIDVRQNPFSRKPGFSKSPLAAAARSHGVRYVAAPQFGCPQEIRDGYKADGDWSCYRRRFTAHLDTLEPALPALAAQARSSRCCLLCFEADPHRCHRSLVAERVVALTAGLDPTLSVVHLRAAAPTTLALDL
jgi:uncharacterized protein (DUF488 family)